MEEQTSNTYSSLQYLLKLSLSENVEDQQKAAIDLAKLVEGNVFPAVSFGPLAHSLCNLIPSSNRTVASFSAKALKVLILDDALRPQTVVAGVPAVVCGAIKQWEEEVLCLRELLGILQTLCWDRQCIRSVLQADILSNLLANDQEVSVTALATLANVLSYSDTLLLSDTVAVEVLAAGMTTIVEIVRTSAKKPQGLYAAACVANGSYHPRLAAAINKNGGLQLCRELERQSLANLHLMGSKLGECAQTSIYRLSERKEGDHNMGNAKYTFKWGTKPVMELSLVPYEKHQVYICFCFVVWLVVILYTFSPLVFV